MLIVPVFYLRALGARLFGVNFPRIFTSPLQRAARTCDPDGFGAVAEIDRDLLEWNYGDHYMHLADQKSYLEADQRLRELYVDSDDRRIRKRDLGGEAMPGAVETQPGISPPSDRLALATTPR